MASPWLRVGRLGFQANRSGFATYWFAAILLLGSLAYVISGTDPLTAKDTNSYINLWSIRTSGYPAFLHALFWLGLSSKAVVLVQFAILLISASYLSSVVYRITGRLATALLVNILLLAAPWMKTYAQTLATEALFIPLLMVWVAHALLFIARPRVHHLAILFVVAAIASTVRPIGVFLFPIILVLLILVRSAWSWRLLGGALVGVLLAAGIGLWESSYYYRFNSPPREFVTGIHFFAEGALIDVPPERLEVAREHLTAPERQLFDRVERDFAPVRTLLHRPWSFGVREHLIALYGGFARSPYLKKLGVRPGPLDGKSGRANTDLTMNVGWARITANPMAFAQRILVHYAALWSPFSIMVPPTAGQYASLVSTGELPFVDEHPPLTEYHAGRFELLVARILTQAFAVLTLGVAIVGAVAVLFSRMSLNAGVSVVTAISLHVYSLLVATFAFGSLRYTTAMWPVVVIFSLFAARWAWSVWHGWRSRPTIGREPR